jgi:hypothetical protein
MALPKDMEAPCPASCCVDESELLQGAHAVVQADFLNDLAIFEAEHGRAGEAHFPAGRRRQRTNEEIAECRTGMCAATLPAADYIVALGDEISSAPEVEIRERFAEVSVMNALMSSRPRRGSCSE